MSNSKPALNVKTDRIEPVKSNTNSSISKITPTSPIRGIGLFKTITNTRSRSVSKTKGIDKSSSSLFMENGQFIDFDTNKTMILEIDPKKLNTLQRAVYDNVVKKVSKLIAEKDRFIDKVDSEHGITGLFLAATLGNVEIARLFFEGSKKSNSDLQCGDFNRTALIQAVINQRDAMVIYLVSQNVNVDIKDKWGCSAVSYTLTSKEITSLKSLLKLKPNLEFNDKSGMGPLHHAARLGKALHSQCLIQGGCSVEARDEQDRTPLHHAIKAGSVQVVEVLLKLGASITAQDMHSKSVLDYLAVAHFNQDISNAIETAKKNYQNEQADIAESSRGYSIFSNASASNDLVMRNNPSVYHKKNDSLHSSSSVKETNDTILHYKSPRHSSQHLQKDSIILDSVQLDDIQEYSDESKSNTSNENTFEKQTPVANTPCASSVDLCVDNVSTNSQNFLELISRYEFEIGKLIQQAEEDQETKFAQGQEYSSTLDQMATLQTNFSEIKVLYEESILQKNALQQEKEMLLSLHVQSSNTERTNENLLLELKLKEEYIIELQTRVDISDSRLTCLTNNTDNERKFATQSAFEQSISTTSLDLQMARNNVIQKMHLRDEKIIALEKRLEEGDIELLNLRTVLSTTIMEKDELILKSDSPRKYTDNENKLVDCELEIMSMQKTIIQQNIEISNMKEANNKNDTKYLEESIKTLEMIILEKESRIVYIESKLVESNDNHNNAISFQKIIRLKDNVIEDLTTENFKLRESRGVEWKERFHSVEYLGFINDIDDQILNLEKAVLEKDLIISTYQDDKLVHAKYIESIKQTNNEQVESSKNEIRSDIQKITSLIDSLRENRQPDSGLLITSSKTDDFNSQKILENVMQNLQSTLNAMTEFGQLESRIQCNDAVVQSFQHSLFDYFELLITDLSMMNDNLNAYSKMEIESVSFRDRTYSSLVVQHSQQLQVNEKNLKIRDEMIERYEMNSKIRDDIIERYENNLKIKDESIGRFEKDLSEMKIISSKSVNNQIAHDREVDQLNSNLNKEINCLKATILIQNEERNALEIQKVLTERESKSKLELLSNDTHSNNLEIKSKITLLELDIQRLKHDKNVQQIQLDGALKEIHVKSEELLDIHARFDQKEKDQVTNREVQVISTDENVHLHVKELQRERIQLEGIVTDISRQFESLQGSFESKLKSESYQVSIVKNKCAALVAEEAGLNNEISRLNLIIQGMNENYYNLKDKRRSISSQAKEPHFQRAHFGNRTQSDGSRHQVNRSQEDSQSDRSRHQVNRSQVDSQSDRSRHQVNRSQVDSQSETILIEEHQELKVKYFNLMTMLEHSNDSMNIIKRELKVLQNEHEKQSESIIRKMQRIRNLEEELTTTRRESIMTAKLGEMLKHQHHEAFQQLQKHGMKSETYMKVPQKTMTSFEEIQPQSMLVHHQSQNDYNCSLQASLNQKHLQNEMRMNEYELEISHQRHLLNEYKLQVLFLENKVEEAHRIHIDLKDEQSTILLHNQTQQQLMREEYAALQNETHKLNDRIIYLIKSNAETEQDMKTLHDSQVHKILRRIEVQSQNRSKLDEIKKSSQTALVDNYEHHIKTLKVELDVLKTGRAQHDTFKTLRNT